MVKFHSRDRRAIHGRRALRAFTLIEVMVAVAIVGILAAIALPNYRDYVLRGQLVDATNLLSAGRASMERYFQDNRTYSKLSGSVFPPCDLLATGRALGSFVLTCDAPAPGDTTYTLNATGSGPTATFTFSVNELGARTTTISSGGPWPAVAANATSCWILRKGQSCPP